MYLILLNADARGKAFPRVTDLEHDGIWPGPYDSLASARKALAEHASSYGAEESHFTIYEIVPMQPKLLPAAND